MSPSFDYDVAVVGSGFGGSVTSLRLTEKGYRVAVFESGRRYRPAELPRSTWRLRRYLWMPRLGMRGIQRMTLLRDVLVLSGAGVGGGSLVYAATHYEPPDSFYHDRHWEGITDWKAELRPWYDQARRMLGTVVNRWHTPADDAMLEVARRLGVEHTFHPNSVGVFFGEPGVEVEDPYYGGAGPRRTGCIAIGACTVGCRWKAKNTLDLNYLHLAERGGCTVLPERHVVALRPLRDGYELVTERPGGWVRKRRRRFKAREVVLCAGVLGTLDLLFKMSEQGQLPKVSRQLGKLVRTNSEALVGATTRLKGRDYSKGTAITSSIYPDESTHIEPVRYPAGSDAMGMLSTILIDGGGRIPRPLRFIGTVARHPIAFLRTLSPRGWARRSVILLVMQALDNSLEAYRSRGPFGFGRRLTSRQGEGESNPTFIPVANEAARHLAEALDGYPRSSWNEALLGIPTTAHILGGATIGDSPETGVVDPYHRVYGHPGLHVSDASVITANLGVNPSLTITAMAERAASLWPNKGQADPRPGLGEPYRRVDPVVPRRPAVPAGAPAELRYGELDRPEVPEARPGTPSKPVVPAEAPATVRQEPIKPPTQ